MFTLASSAPHVIRASSIKHGGLLSNDPMVGLGRWEEGKRPVHMLRDQLCHFTGGRATFTSRITGQSFEVGPSMLVHFRAGYAGEVEVHQRLAHTFMQAEGGGPLGEVHFLKDVYTVPPDQQWGDIGGGSTTCGVILARKPETGVWICTPGTWDCVVTSDEFCHFLLGRCTYTHHTGEVIPIEPDTAAFFPRGWRGVCTVHETVRKVYLIR